MLTKVNVLGIVGEHLKTLRRFDTRRISLGDICLFFVLPLAAAVGLVYYKVLLTDAIVGTLLACYSILTALLFSVLVLIFDVCRTEGVRRDRGAAEEADNRLKVRLLRETFANVSYCIVLGIALSLLLILGLKDAPIVRLPVSVLVFAGSGNFVLTLFMILKRMHSLLDVNVSDAP